MSLTAQATRTRPVPFTGVVAIDGPSGTGKSTVARRLARKLRSRYLDTGAMYRAAAVGVLGAGVNIDDAAAVAECVRGLEIAISTDAAPAQVLLGGQDVTRAIRTATATRAVTPVSAIPAVRELLVTQQRQLIGRGRIVVEGRDIGSVVWPTADLKIYLTANSDVRAARRAGELAEDPALVRLDLQRRDDADMFRAAGPLLQADDSIEVDTSELDAEQVLDRLLNLVAAKVAVSRA